MARRLSTRGYVPKALAFVERAHAGQKRTSGEPFTVHLKTVADLLREIGADEETVTAGLLHDILEDTPITAEKLHKEFGPVITALVEGVTKVQQLEKTFDKRVRNMESIRKMFRTMGKDIRVLFIKLADRLHNMRTIGYVPEEKQLRIARETLDIYCPLANLLGVRAWYQEFADLCFGVLDPVEFELVRKKYELAVKGQEKQLKAWIADMQRSLGRQGFKKMTIEREARHFREIRTMTVNQEILLNHIETFHRVRITLPTIKDCYAALMAVHQYASPVPHRIDDYIASPKVNRYQALHTVVLSSKGNPITVILQTPVMKDLALLGTATVFKAGTVTSMRTLPNWVEALRSLEEDEENLQMFFRRVEAEIFGKQHRIQLSNGKKRSIDIPAYASALDLAYYAGGNLGLRARSAIVNGEEVSLKHLIEDGDAVSIIKGKTSERDAQDLYYIHTALAHKILVKDLSALPHKVKIQRGKQLLAHAIDITMDPFFGVRWQKTVHDEMMGDATVLPDIARGVVDAFMYVEERGMPENFFLLDPVCFETTSRLSTTKTRYVLRTSLQELQEGNILGLQAGPDVVEVLSADTMRRDREQTVSKEIVPLTVRRDHVRLPFHFALRWNFQPGTNPLKDITTLQGFLDTPLRLLQFQDTSITLCFHTDRLRTVQIGYKHLFGLSHVSNIFRTTPQ